VVVVSPSYCGVASDLAAIATVAHDRGAMLFVDEAWAPHIHFHPALPLSAMQSGADGAVGSVHKVLAGLTQASVLHAQGPRVDVARVATAVGMVQTTSPAATILASIDAARRQMALDGERLLDRTIALAGRARFQLDALSGISLLSGERLGLDPCRFDPTKLVVDVHEAGLSGFAAEQALRDRFAIQPEMSDLVSVVCLITIGDTEESVNRLATAFAILSAERTGPAGGLHLRSTGIAIAPGEQALSPRDAFFAPSRAVPLSETAGQVSAELVIPYPPGIPVLAPGDIISGEKIEYLQHGASLGMYLSGPADPRLATLRIVDDRMSTG